MVNKLGCFRYQAGTVIFTVNSYSFFKSGDSPVNCNMMQASIGQARFRGINLKNKPKQEDYIRKMEEEE
ncbi:MAG: hypothetical protein D3922_06580 [Candidatus Electrothrix sp. AR1]|nr:hypothetical protein [Candidatus Electrothrix sp. AR1]